MSCCVISLLLPLFLPSPFPHSLVRSFVHPILHLSKAFDYLQSSLERDHVDLTSISTRGDELEGKRPDRFGLFQSVEGQTVWILEAKLNLTVRRPVLSFASLFSLAACSLIFTPPPRPQNQYTSAKGQLNGYEDIATKKWPGYSVVKVMAGHHLSDERVKMAVNEGFKVLKREGTEFERIGF